MIFIERDTALSVAEIDDKLAMLKEACATDDDLKAKEVLRKVVPTFKKPEEVNKTAFKKQHRENEENSKKGMKVGDVYQKYDCFLFPTLNENYGHVIAEALANGCQVVLSKGTTPWDDLHLKAGYVCQLDEIDSFTEA